MDSPYNFNNLSQAAKEAFFNGISKEISGEGDVLPSATPVNAVAAAATLTSTGSAPTDGNTVTIGDITYIFDHSDDIDEDFAKRYIENKNCIVYPPIAFRTEEATVSRWETLVSNVENFIQGNLQNVVN